MPRLHVTRREALLGGLTAAGGLLLTGCATELPPTYGHLLRMGDNLTYAAHRALLPGQSLAREYTRGDFADFRPEISGRVARPGSYALSDLKRMPARTQITRHLCEEGWSAIAEWTGVPLGHVLEAAGMNGRDLPVPHGGPLRVRVETQVGYKSVKFVRRLRVHDEFDDLGAHGSIRNGWSWYAGI